VAFIPLLEAVHDSTPRQALRLGFFTGMVSFGGLLYWVNIVMTTYGKLPLPVSFVIYLLLVAYLALYPAIFAWCVKQGEEVRLSQLLVAPIAWTALEFIRANLMTGFPWASLGHSQFRVLPLIQIADLTGVYGISFIIIFGNVILWRLGRALLAGEPYPFKGAALFFLVLTAVVGYGVLRLNTPEDGATVRVSLLQGNIPQDVKWDPAFQERTVAVYERLARESCDSGAELVVWPESAAPFYLQDDRAQAGRIQGLARDLKACMVVGSPAYEVEGGRVRYLNSAFHIDQLGTITGRSDKVHLVPFGEYVPLAGLLPFVSKVVQGIGDFSPGKGTYPLASGKGALGVLICFEGIFPEVSRGYVNRGAGLLVNITNDAWFGRSSAPYQHLSMTVFRAVENRVPLVRAANTGISALIDAKGHVRGMTTLFSETHLGGEIRLGSGGTFYCKAGDIFAQLCLLTGGTLAAIVYRRRRTGREDSECSETKRHV
jgi:apolipoprotein N-acyltransferase